MNRDGMMDVDKGKYTGRWKTGVCTVLILVFALGFGTLAQGITERHSNGLGGGRWSDSSTWHGGILPAASDHVVITASDTVIFDAGERDIPNCAALSIDPSGVLTFRLDGSSQRLKVAGRIESYGTIRVDASDDRGSRVAIMLCATQPEQRVIRLLRGSALLLYGTASGSADDSNVVLASEGNAEGGSVEATGDVLLDLQGIRISGIHLRATGIDNTGYRPLQRLNLVNNRFRDGARLTLEQCDTAVIQKNHFLQAGDSTMLETAITLQQCSLTACKDNRIEGYAQGVEARRDVDVAIQGNVVSGAKTGISLRTGRNGMIKGNRLLDCEIGLLLEEATGVVEGLRLEKVRRSIYVRKSTVQLMDVAVGEKTEDVVPLTLHDATVTLLNCNISADSIKLEGSRPPGAFWVQNMNYLVLRVTGKKLPRAVVQVNTAAVSGGVPKGAADLNVRNVPARVSENGWTPLPRTLSSIVLRSWQIDASKKLNAAPFYDLLVMPVVDATNQAPSILHKQVVEPRDEWFRADPNAMEPTLEVKIP